MKLMTIGKSIQAKLSFYIAIVTTLFFIVIIIGDYMRDSSNELSRLQVELELTGNYAEISIRDALWNLDEATINNVINAISEDQNIVYVSVKDDDRDLIYEINETHLKLDSNEIVFLKKDIIRQDQKLGEISIGLSKKQSQQRLINNIEFSLLKFALLEILMLLTVHQLSKLISKPIQQLTQRTEAIASGDLSTELLVVGDDEVAHLAHSVNKMQSTIKNNIEKIQEDNEIITAFNEELEQTVNERTEHLKNAITQLEHTQELLAESKKLASMGQLVSGLAHEINTPLGTSITGITYVKELNKSLNRAFQMGNIGKNDLVEFITEVDQSTELIANSLLTVTNLIDQFKKLSGDIYKNELGMFELNEMIISLNEVQKSKSLVKDVKLTVDSVGFNRIYSYLDAFEMILSSLISNSYDHAFQKEAPGEISVKSWVEENKLLIEYRDNGCGIDEETIKQIFNPFFTTSRSSGGVGLGLSMVSNIVTVLNGTIACNSQFGNGVRFMLSLPLAETLKIMDDNYSTRVF